MLWGSMIKGCMTSDFRMAYVLCGLCGALVLLNLSVSD